MKEQTLKNPKLDLNAPKKKKGSFSALLGKLSGAFMLPISLLAFGGIFLGIGAGIVTNTSADTFLNVSGNFIEQIGNCVFGMLPLLFCVSIAIAYTNQAAIAGFTALVAWMAFNALTSALVAPVLDDKKEVIYYYVRGFGGSIYEDISTQLMTSNQGIMSFNTSVFGAITIGGISAYVYNTFSTKELPMVISFFSGQRLAPIMAIIFMIPLTFIFLIIWPIVGKGLQSFGTALGNAPYGLNALVFGYVERALVPFGLHHVFYAPLWWTGAGGSVSLHDFIYAVTGGQYSDYDKFMAHKGNFNSNIVNEIKKFHDMLGNSSIPAPRGDVNMWFFFERMPSNIYYMSGGGLHHMATFDFVKHPPTIGGKVAPGLGYTLGAYTQGKYPFMIFGLPAAAAAMVYAAPKENRKMAASVCISAVASSFISGITEPIEFTFLFLAPWLFWGVHAVYAAISFWLMALFGGHIGMTFSGGLIDYIVYGLLPYSHGTKAWLVPVIGVVYAPLYFFTFFFAIKKFNIETPGRGKNTRLFTKKDFKAKKAGDATGALSIENQYIVAGMGGWDNITSYQNCANRLRYDIVDKSKINEDLIMQGGGKSIVYQGDNHIQVIYGMRAGVVNAQIKASINAPLTDVQPEAKKTPDKKTEVKAKEAAPALAKAVPIKGVINGTLKPIDQVKDEMFAKRTLGDGIAITPSKGKQEIVAPFSGVVEVVFPTGHAFGLDNGEGVKIMIHAGIDTVKLNGKGFTTKVKQGDKVKAGQVLGTMDVDIVTKAGYKSDVMVILLNESKGKAVITKTTGRVTKATTLFNAK